MEESKTTYQNTISKALHEAFPEDAKVLLRLCNHGLDQPLGFDHPFIIEDLVGKNLSEKDFENIRLAYVMVTAYYFLLDAVADDHLENKLHSLYLTHLLTLACQKFDEVIFSNPHIDSSKFNKIFHQLISENAKAIRLENEFASNPFSYSEQNEYASIVGRSNSSIILLQIIATLTESDSTNDLEEILKDFAFFVQLGDDLADWRDDFKTKKYTSFLREIFSKHNRVLTEEELEEEIYLTTIFEARAVKVIKGLERITKQIEKRSSDKGKHLKLLIQLQIEKIKILMTHVIEIKLKAKSV
jgi:hypothetical protein